VFFKGCPLRCRWCQNPESIRSEPEVAFYADRCRGARDCEAACAKGALQWYGDRILRSRCDACGRCAEACAFDALRLVGRKVSIKGLMEEVERDAPFYRASAGGVTVSGGEATLQMDFLGAFARRCGEQGLNIGLQTCGLFRWESFLPHLPLFEFIQFDLKLMDAEQHRKMTGGDNRAILDNARRLVAVGAPVSFRMPVVPGITDHEDNLRQTGAFLHDLGVPVIHLLRYHAMGEAKLARIGNLVTPFALPNGSLTGDSLQRAAEILSGEGLRVAA
jgi:pyruvate formate lyase activating enzyme